ncbi:MAG: flavin reductase (DIM6/NTAB) family NADH-FMN oxidoreductase RutF [Halioglobus sp.]|jgi:flavin reductase (DIM6/NTAB) family NADH-FMN oxidoreductase RutF
MRLDKDQLRDMDSRIRAAFVNSLSGFKSANLVGTIDDDGRTNLAIMSSTVHLGSSPPLLALVIRPGGEERHTLDNILSTGYYSINHVTAPIIEAAHQSAARYGRDTSEFEATGLTPFWREGFAAPMVAEAGIKLGLALREHQELSINRTHLVIGEVVLAEIPPGSLRDDGGVDLVKAGSVALSGLDTYYKSVAFKRMAYAKPGLTPRDLFQHEVSD